MRVDWRLESSSSDGVTLAAVQFSFCPSFFVWSRHERIHTKRGSQVKMPSEPEEVSDLATLELLDEVGGACALLQNPSAPERVELVVF